MQLRDVSTQVEAEEWLSEYGKRLVAWCVETGHDARKSVVPKWAQPLPRKIPNVLKVDGVKEEEPVLFDLPAREKQKSKTSKAAKNARKAQREAWAAKAQTYLPHG